jgi:hypothetical protein
MPASDGLVSIRGNLKECGDSAPNKGVQLAAYSLRLRAGVRQQLTPGVRVLKLRCMHCPQNVA